MRATKKQIAVITVLNLVIAALIALFVYFKTPLFRSASSETDDGAGGGNNGAITDGDGTTNVDTPPQQPVHNKLRDAASGKVKEIAYETRLMGTGDESVVFATAIGGVTYIFGNAVVPDYDFDSSGGFLCRIGSNGKILGFSYFSGKLTAVGVIDGGFGAATVADAGTEDEKSQLFGVTGDGEITPLFELEGAAVDVMPIMGSKKMAVVCRISSGTLKLTEYTRAGTGWAVGKSTRMSNGLSIEYFDCYYVDGEYIVSARASSGAEYDTLLFYTFAAGGEPTSHYPGGSDEKPYAVVPFGSGYLALCEKEGNAAIVTFGKKFTSYSRDRLDVKSTDGRLFFCGGKYYACFVTKSGAVTYEIDGSLDMTRTLTKLDGVGLAAVVSMDSNLFVGASSTAVTVTDCAEISATLDVNDVKISRVIKTGYNELLIVLTAKGGGALSDSTGGDDVYVISVKL